MERPVLADLELASAKVLLRPISISDVDAAYALVHRRPAVTHWLVWDGPESREELVRRFESWVDARAGGVGYQFAVVDRASGTFCGAIGLRFADGSPRGGLGYWLGEPYWSVGFGTQAVALVARLAFEHLGARLLYAHVFDHNVASERVLVKNGFREDEHGGDLVQKGGVDRARRYFRLTAGAWRARSSGEALELERVILRPSVT